MTDTQDLLTFESTEEISVPDSLLQQVIGQDEAVSILRQASRQGRFLLLIGAPGTGKSMLGLALSELLPMEGLEDVLVFPNPEERVSPKIRVVNAGEGERIVQDFKAKRRREEASLNLTFWLTLFFLILMAVYYAVSRGDPMYLMAGGVLAAILLGLRRYLKIKGGTLSPKLLINYAGRSRAPFVDATGFQSGALLGDVRHDPFQSGGVETPPHELIEAGAIHRAHRGVLYIDEVATLGLESQLSLLTAIQEKRFVITGRNPGSSGTMVRTEPVPCDFLLVLAGNLNDVEGMHPALRSRIRGYGYEVYTNEVMEDTRQNRDKLAQFVAQEVRRDRKIPHFSRGAVVEMIGEARRRAGQRGKLSLRLRDLGGLVRAAGDLAQQEGAPLAEADHVTRARELVKPLEEKIAEKTLDRWVHYTGQKFHEDKPGRTCGLGVFRGAKGFVLPIGAQVFTAWEKGHGKWISSRALPLSLDDLRHCLEAWLRFEEDQNLADYDVYLQLLGPTEDIGLEGCGLPLAVAVLSSLKGIPVDPGTALVGRLALGGEVLPVVDVHLHLEAVLRAGLRRLIVPADNAKELWLGPAEKRRLEIIAVDTISEALACISLKNRTQIFADERR